MSLVQACWSISILDKGQQNNCDVFHFICLLTELFERNFNVEERLVHKFDTVTCSRLFIIIIQSYFAGQSSQMRNVLLFFIF